MKFNEIAANEWKELMPYLDTCLLPLTGLSGEEDPAQATQALEELRDLLDPVEIPFKGRVVTYPSVHFFDRDESGVTYINRICQKIRKVGFRFIVIVSRGEEKLDIPEADIVLSRDDFGLNDEGQSSAAQKIVEMWKNKDMAP